jgi:hypothetical protein
VDKTAKLLADYKTYAEEACSSTKGTISDQGYLGATRPEFILLPSCNYYQGRYRVEGWWAGWAAQAAL